ncbi:MAG: dihydroorotate oxidase [Pseudomonadota bacterium]
MGLRFANRLGLAAGVDRTGSRVAELSACGFGHVELGTFDHDIAPKLARHESGWPIRIGISIASPRTGLGEAISKDFVALLREARERGDYVVAALSSPHRLRDGGSPGVDLLIKRLRRAENSFALETTRRVPLLVKVLAGDPGSPMPLAVVAAREHGLDGVVLVSRCCRRLAEVVRFLGDIPVISVGGIATACEAQARLGAGAALLQVHSGFVRQGSALVDALLRATSPA